MSQEKISEENPHILRLSLDVRTIKNAEFKGLIYAKYPSLSVLGIKQFKTLPAIEVLNGVEEKFNNSFASYTFEKSKCSLISDLSSNSLTLDIYHQDRLKADILIGQTKINFSLLLEAQIRKTNQSYVRVYDSYFPVDEINENMQPVKKVAEIRVILYLEDLGPKEEAGEGKEYEKEFEGKVGSEKICVLPEIGDEGGEKMSDNPLNEEIQNLEFKIVWELENWKKTEEMKFSMMLKAREAEYLSKLNEDMKKKDFEKEKKWKQVEANILSIESKMRSKVNDLMKREQKIVFLEEEFKQKMNEISRICAGKDEELNDLKKKMKTEKASFDNERSLFNARLLESENKYDKLLKEYQIFKKDQENSPLNIIKNELNDKNLEIRSLQKELEKANQLKEEYKQYYEKIREEIIQLKKAYEKLKSDQTNQTSSEIERLKLQIAALQMQSEKGQFANLRADILSFKAKNFGEDQEENLNSRTSKENPFKKSLITNNKTSSFKEINKPISDYHWNQEGLSEYDRISKERAYLLESGYSENDPLIQELADALSQLRH